MKVLYLSLGWCRVFSWMLYQHCAPAQEVLPVDSPEITLDAAPVIERKERFLSLNKCSGPGCPYMGAWLAHSDHYMKASWNLVSRKMEEATFNMFHANVYQTDMAHHVKHMSAFEHSVNNARMPNASSIIEAYINAAYDGECDDLMSHPVASNSFLALVPFYGGMPPSATKTIDGGIPTNGEGHSKTSPLLKAYATMATVCSCLKYFGRVVIGLTSDSDENLIETELKGMNPVLEKRINILRFSIPRPSALPFHVLTWGQRFVMHHNCKVLNRQDGAISGHNAGELAGLACDKYKHVKNMKNIQSEHKFILNKTRTMHFPVNVMIDYVYYTESDQIVFFKDQETFEAISKASNSSTMILGRRAEKYTDKNKKLDSFLAQDYTNGYSPGRYCGKAGFELSFQDAMVRAVHPKK